ncbi:hypothetical protein T02_8829 [Trichinella nativa]|uniref:Uncharacterized protein n=1 Tax=Trichinella nativa TaxID=6335 RepID=A0A0V1L5W7_9BILA|nr:hypothetical protein T02_8829 [Trichinella nativa]
MSYLKEKFLLENHFTWDFSTRILAIRGWFETQPAGGPQLHSKKVAVRRTAVAFSERESIITLDDLRR